MTCSNGGAVSLLANRGQSTLRGSVVSSLHPGNVTTSSRRFSTPLMRKRGRERALRRRERGHELWPPQIHKPRKLPVPPSPPSPIPFSSLQPVSSRSPPLAAAAGPSGPRPAQDVARRRSAGKKCRVRRRAAAPRTGGRVSPAPNRQPTAPPALPTACGLRSAASARVAAPRRAARVGLGARRVAEAAGPNARGSETGRGRGRGPEPGPGAGQGGAAPEGSPRAARRARQPLLRRLWPFTYRKSFRLGAAAAPPASASGARWAGFPGRGGGRPPPRVAASRGPNPFHGGYLSHSRVYTGWTE